MTINDDELEKVIEEVLENEREQIYLNWIGTEEILMDSLRIKHYWFKGKSIVLMDLNEWEQYNNGVKELLQALLYAYKYLESLKQEKEQKTALSFDEYIKKQIFDYDSEEFERVRDKFDIQYTTPSQEEMER